MKTVEELAEPLLEKLDEWKQPDHQLTVGIDGYPGVGKTSIASILEGTGARVIHQDEYLLPLDQRLQLVETSENLDSTIIFDFYDSHRLRHELEDASDDEVLVVEGVFVLDRRRYLDVWDKTVYVDSDDWDRVDIRRIAREKQRWGDQYMPETDPRSLFPKITNAYRRWAEAERPREIADLILDTD